MNDAILRFSSAQPPAVAVCSIDPRWVCRHRDFLASYHGEKFVAVPLDTWPDCDGIPGVTYLHRSHAPGLSDDPRALCTGGNSGYAAINLAYLKRARRIHLIGYDMDPQSNEIYEQWAPRFRTMLPQLWAGGVRITNHNEGSHIDAFPKEAL